MSRVEFLKKFVAFNKRHKVPLPLIKAQLYVILVVCFIHYAIVKGINGVKYAICYPFVKVRDYCKKNIYKVFQVECIVITICISFLIISEHGRINTVQPKDGALAGETYSDGEIMGDMSEDESVDNVIHEMTSGNISNSTDEEDATEESTEEITQDTNANINTELPYLVKVNRVMNCVTIYTQDETGEYTVPYKAMICSTGGELTPAGTFTMSQKYDFKELFYQSYGQYCSRVYGSILFHSSGNNSLNKDDLNASDFNNLGLGVSHGCIRLTVEDAKWIHDNCPSGTQVVIYDSVVAGPLGKPECIKVPEGTVWDPTDPDENNPWKDKKPWFEGASDRVLYEDDILDYMEGIKAYDTCGNDITHKVVVTGEADLSMPGQYLITYSVTDLLGRSAEYSAVFTVK